MSTLQISLPDELRAWVESEARGNGYADVGEFVGVLVRYAKTWYEEQSVPLTDEEFLGGRTEAELAALINEGLASESRPMTVDLWAEMLGEADEKLKEKGVESHLRQRFLKKQQVEETVSA